MSRLVSFLFFLRLKRGRKTFKIFVPRKKKKKKKMVVENQREGTAKGEGRKKEGRRVDSEERLEFGSREAK